MDTLSYSLPDCDNQDAGKGRVLVPAFWAFIIVAILAFPLPKSRVTPSLLFMLGVAHQDRGETEIAKAYYRTILDFEDRFGYSDIHLSKNRQFAQGNLRVIEIRREVEKAIAAHPFLRRGK